MRPKLLAVGAGLAVLAFLAWPADEPQEAAGVEASTAEGDALTTQAAAGAPAQASALLAVGLATASLAVILQALRPSPA